MKKTLSLVLVVILAFSLMTGCINNGPAESQNDSKLPPVYGDTITPTDYSIKENWMKLPDTDFDVDVFFLYPTSWTRAEDESYYCTIDNESMRSTAPFAYTKNGAVFEAVANVYAPYYRQIDAVWSLADSLVGDDKYFEGVPYTDAVAAFEYYLENYNNGKPFILAGHSQGSAVTKSILKYYMKDHPEIYERMVAAYVVGYSVTKAELEQYPHLKFAEGADDTGVIISWNTEAPGTTVNPLLLDGAVCINPITWTREEITASKEQNKGSHIADNATGTFVDIDSLADATVNKERGSIICSSVDVDTYAPGVAGLFPRGVYHLFEYGFYFENIRENAQTRIDAYLNK